MDESRQTQYDANNTGASMYLSFDSSISSAAYRTLDTTTNEHSLVSNMDYEDTTPENSQDLNQDSTLEALDSHVDYIELVKDMDTQSQPCALPKRVLQQFNVVSSTPSKEQLLRSVEVIRGSSAERCIDLRRAFMDMEDKDKENTLPLAETEVLLDKKLPTATVTKGEKKFSVIETTINNKVGCTSSENNTKAKDNEKGSILATFEDYKELLVVNQKNGNTSSEDVLKAKPVDKERATASIPENKNPINIIKDVKNPIPDSIFNSKSYSNEKALTTITENKEPSNMNIKDGRHKSYEGIINRKTNENEKAIATGKANKDQPVNAAESLKINGNQNPANKNPAIAKAKRTSIAKRPVCEPNLMTNRPSRIATNAYKRLSVNDIGMKADLEKEISTEIPKLMNKVLKFAESTTVVIDKSKTAVVFDKHKSISYATKGRSSMLPSTASSHGEKRPFAYTQRMSVLVKTTLNSPARKIARRSCAIPGQPNWKSLPATNAPPKSNRKSMLPVGKSTQSSTGSTSPPFVTKPPIEAKPMTTTTTSTIATKSNISSRKSMYTGGKVHIDLQKSANVVPKIPASNTKMRQSVAGKMDTSFVCSVCGSKFSIKSLLDAHKRSHEGDGLPAFVKKTAAAAATTTTTSNAASTISQANGVNKCKYCDKKFALQRTLHIHLLQNCPKIPPKEKRKLNFHEMDHVEKAHLPAFFHATSLVKTNIHEQASTAVSALQHRSASDLSSVSVSSTDSTNDKRALAEITMIANNAAAAVDSLLPEMAPPSARSVKKSTAHTGVHRTPNKSIICHTCKISFKTIMDHIEHNMKVHFNNTDAKKNADATNGKLTQ